MLFTYFPKRVGFHWEIWYKFSDDSVDPYNGSKEWRACYVNFWRKITAMKIASDLNIAYANAVHSID